ncbi:MAG TPA: hemolysin family protein [Gemmatimonadaceae bacterium]|nr:hemolysin family protein [Gemmatimonadaceae bacterium]
MSTLIAPLAIALVVVAWLTAAATAVRSVSRIWLRHWAERQLGGSVTEAYLAQPQRLLLASATMTALAVALVGTVLGARLGAEPAELAAGVVITALIFLLLGQLVPRAIGRHWASRLIPVLLPPLHASEFFMGPLIRASERLASAVFEPRPEVQSSARDGLQTLLREGEMEGIGEPEEIEIITGVVEFGEKTLRDVMTPRTDVFALDISTPPEEMARAIAKSGYSRVPLYRGSLDEVVGMVHVFDVLKVGAYEKPFVHEVAHAPASKHCSEMLFEMLRGQRHLAVVLDEFGGTAGIVTLEDVLEELVGDIRDEHDEPLPEDEMGSGIGAAVIEASAPLDEVLRRFGAEQGIGNGTRAQSLGGVVVRALGRIPTLGERFRLGDLELTVVEAEPSRVLRLLVQRSGTARSIAIERVR